MIILIFKHIKYNLLHLRGRQVSVHGVHCNLRRQFIWKMKFSGGYTAKCNGFQSLLLCKLQTT